MNSNGTSSLLVLRQHHFSTSLGFGISFANPGDRLRCGLLLSSLPRPTRASIARHCLFPDSASLRNYSLFIRHVLRNQLRMLFAEVWESLWTLRFLRDWSICLVPRNFTHWGAGHVITA